LIFEYEKPKNVSLDNLLKKIQYRVKVNTTNESSKNVNFNEETDALKFEYVSKFASITNNSDFSNVSINDLNKEIEELNSTKLNSSVISENSTLKLNNDNNFNYTQSIFSGLFGKANFLKGIVSPASTSPQERPISFYFSVCFTSLFETANIFNLVQDANRKLKTKSNSAKPNSNMLESFIMVHEKAKKEKLILKTHKKYLFEENLIDDQDEDSEIPIYLEDLFKNEEFEFLKNEFKIKNSFGINDNGHINIMLKNIKAFVINFDYSLGGFSLFGNLNNKNKSVLNKNRKILFLGNETLYFIEENFELLNVEFFVDNYLYIQNIDKNASFAVTLEIEFKDILDIEIKDNQCFVEYMLDKRNHNLKFKVNKREENEFIYFYLMKNLVRKIANKQK